MIPLKLVQTWLICCVTHEIIDFCGNMSSILTRFHCGDLAFYRFGFPSMTIDIKKYGFPSMTIDMEKYGRLMVAQVLLVVNICLSGYVDLWPPFLKY